MRRCHPKGGVSKTVPPRPSKFAKGVLELSRRAETAQGTRLRDGQWVCRISHYVCWGVGPGQSGHVNYREQMYALSRTACRCRLDLTSARKVDECDESDTRANLRPRILWNPGYTLVWSSERLKVVLPRLRGLWSSNRILSEVTEYLTCA